MAERQRPEPPDGTAPGVAARAGRVVGAALGSAVIAIRGAARATREVIRRDPRADTAYRTGVGVLGGVTVALGVALIPLPGPGSLIALGGLGILGTEFERAKKVNQKATVVVRKAASTVAERRAAKRAASSTPPEPDDAAQASAAAS